MAKESQETIHYSMRLPRHIHGEAERIAESEGRSLANWIKRLLEVAIQEQRGDASKRAARR